MFGQLLRRMPREQPGPETRFAVVVPLEARTAVQRVPNWLMRELRIGLYLVDLDGSVTKN